MSTISVTQLYEQLTKGVGKETAENLCSYINGKIKEELEDQTKILSTKEDISGLKLDIEQLRAATKEDVAGLKLDIEQLRMTTKGDVASLKMDIEQLRMTTKVDIASLKMDIEQLRIATKLDIEHLRAATKEDMAAVLIKMSENKAETMRWMFIFWVGQVAATFGLLMMFLKR